MLEQFKNWCNKPYYLIDNFNIKTSMVLGVGLFTYLFLYTFQPYGIDQVVNANHFLIVGYGFLVSFSLFISYFILPKLLPFYFSVKSWTVQKEALFLLFSFLIISTTNYFYHTAFVAVYLPDFSFIRFVSVVFSIGIFPVLFIIFMVERHLYRVHNARPANIIEKIRKEKKENVVIPSDNIKEAPLVLDIDTVLYAQSNNNYTTISYLENNVVKHELMRITLKKVADILEKYPQFIRCHRSFLINKNEILNVEGNARSLQVHLKYVKDVIPVSRSFPKDQLTS
ncbi:LytTR family DNA-binding domain-containing protein [Wenyingzhuangia sp. 1_MG-2023]|nr:LytTR family DNA-binding domain-containing protein [Wenyingzhuangia sp. 1_MG-2023]